MKQIKIQYTILYKFNSLGHGHLAPIRYNINNKAHPGYNMLFYLMFNSEGTDTGEEHHTHGRTQTQEHRSPW